VIVNRVEMRNVQDWDTPLPTQRHHGDCIESNLGNSPNARFTGE
jgi:hypothetical protein